MPNLMKQIRGTVKWGVTKPSVKIASWTTVMSVIILSVGNVLKTRIGAFATKLLTRYVPVGGWDGIVRVRCLDCREAVFSMRGFGDTKWTLRYVGETRNKPGNCIRTGVHRIPEEWRGPDAIVVG